jgi:hypothetical protein
MKDLGFERHPRVRRFARKLEDVIGVDDMFPEPPDSSRDRNPSPPPHPSLPELKAFETELPSYVDDARVVGHQFGVFTLESMKHA